MSATLAMPRATLDDLARVEGKAELVGGKVVLMMPTGHRPSQIAGKIYRRLADHSDAAGGLAYSDGAGFAIHEISTGRESFCPDAAYYSGAPPANEMKFVPGPPDLAVEVRSDSDYGPAAEAAMASKRAEYFEAGTRVVWDVDTEARIVRSYRFDADEPIVFGAGQEADAEPAVTGWRLSIDWLMA